ncbi:serine hydrolase-like protein 2 [Aethina tumida]|uniref:serine hydrolase-like protein 2 n=1 Tax=Aethina tumida TaxID=116153 RepID=UPI002147BA8A|nr:serine hydrolase-like protein 2 [Aethina tumida]
MNIEEFTVKVPWGKIAVKAWGKVTDPIVLCIHGVQDNAASFDLLIPELPNNYYYVCYDLPCHGKSSPYPPHMPLHSIHEVIVLKLIVDYFERNEYIIIGHSYGGVTATLFSQLFPEIVKKLILLEAIYSYSIAVEDFQTVMLGHIDKFMEISKKTATGSPPRYTYDEALKKVQHQRANGKISLEAAKALLERNVVQIDNKYVFTTDQRLKNIFIPLNDNTYQLKLLKEYPITAPTLLILGKDSEYRLPSHDPIVDFFEKSKNFKVITINGTHDIHNVNTKEVAKLVTSFLVNVKPKL